MEERGRELGVLRHPKILVVPETNNKSKQVYSYLVILSIGSEEFAVIVR